MKAFLAAILILVLIISYSVPFAAKIKSVKQEIVIRFEKISSDNISADFAHLDSIINIIEENLKLFEHSVPKNIYEPMLLSAKKLRSYAENGSADLFSAEYEVFKYYAEQLTF